MECDIDEFFLDILRHDELVTDYTVYGRTLWR